MSDETSPSTVHTTPRSRADKYFTAFILGAFAAAWFGWARGGAADELGIYLTIGAVASLVVALAGGVMTLRKQSDLTAARDKAASAAYGKRVGLTYLIAGVGIAALLLTDQPRYVAPWVAFVIGAHFWVLVGVLRDRMLIPLGIVVVAVSIAAVVVGLTTDVPPNVVTGIGTGVALLGYAAINLLTGPKR